jgi:GNAT superfamily N-acetyltransferase
MIRLSPEMCAAVFEEYRANEHFFPLVGAVLLGTQDGHVYANDGSVPTQVYVEHAFGFSQLIGSRVAEFERQLETYLLTIKAFRPQKIRLYTPHLPEFLASMNSLMAQRQRFVIRPDSEKYLDASAQPLAKDVSATVVDVQNIEVIDEVFGISDRFWRGSSDFLRHANAVLVSYNAKPAAICYAAAEADRRVEIDVMTLPEYRNLGLGRVAVVKFLTRCFDLSLTPLWDCFTNNAGSMTLSASVGFIPRQAPYPFFTIPR